MDASTRRRIIAVASGLLELLPEFSVRNDPYHPQAAHAELPFGLKLAGVDVERLRILSRAPAVAGEHDVVQDGDVEELLRIGGAVVMVLRQIEVRVSVGAASAERMLNRLAQ